MTRADGGPSERVVTGLADSSTPTWSTDGKWLFFSGLVDGASQILKVRPEGGASIQLTRGGGLRPRESPDGSRVYYSTRAAGGIRSVSVEGGDEAPVAGLPSRPDAFAEAWAVTAQGIYLVDPKLPSPGIDFFAFTTRKLRRVFDTAGSPEAWTCLAVSPDGRTLLYSQLEGNSGDIMLVDGLP